MKAIKIISAFAILTVMISSHGIPNTKAQTSYFPKDIDSHWAEEEISTLMYAGILRGDSGSARANDTITRGEFTALTARALSLFGTDTAVFSDIPKTHMFFDEISAAHTEGLVNGIGGNLFMPQNNITREEIMLIISRCMPDTKTTTVKFRDIASSYTYIAELRKAVASGIITGFDDGTFRPKTNATRAECAVMLVRLLKALEDIDKDSVLKLCREYIDNELENTSKNIPLSSGRALSEVQYKIDTQNEISQNATEVEKLPGTIRQVSYSIDGHTASAVFEGDITYIITNTNGTRQRTYSATHKLDIIEKDGEILVYNYDLSLAKKGKVNLTWEVYSTVPDYAPMGVNVVSPSSFQISAENLGVEKNNLSGNINFYNSLTRKYMNYARENGYEVWPIYKTDFTTKTSDTFLSNADTRKKAVSYLTQYACKYLIDGINIDFENVYERNRHLLSEHARELSLAMHEMGMIVSVDITRKETTSANWSMCYNRDLLNDNTDYIMLMAYDEHYASSKNPGSVASLDWTRESIERTLKEVNPQKLILGIPFYMRYFEVQNGKVTSTKAIGMQTAYDLINSNNVTYTYMESDEQYKISWKNGNKTCVFWLENTDTIQKRVSLANEYNLAGVASWRRGLEISKVWDTIKNNL